MTYAIKVFITQVFELQYCNNVLILVV